MGKYQWIVEQPRLSQFPGKKVAKVAELIVEGEGNESERHGLSFGLIPLWAKRKAESLIRQAQREQS
jgi:hypothetical protein